MGEERTRGVKNPGARANIQAPQQKKRILAEDESERNKTSKRQIKARKDLKEKKKPEGQRDEITRTRRWKKKRNGSRG